MKHKKIVPIVFSLFSGGLFWPAEDPNPSFKQTIFPLIQAKCNQKDCHNVQRNNPIFTTYEGIQKQGKRIVKRIKDRNLPMPPPASGVTLTKAEIALIESWVNAGMPKN